MANFHINGMNELLGSIEQLASLSDEEKMSVIMPGAEVALQRQREKIEELFVQRTGNLANSLTIEEKVGETGPYAWIFPKGKHKNSSTGKRKGKRRSNGNYSGTNAEVAYILEYGSPRINTPFHWMETANEEAMEEVASAQQSAWDELLTKKGL